MPGPEPRGCEGCHDLDRAKGFLGTDGLSTFEGETQEFKIVHLRNLYQKIGMFGMPPNTLIDVGDNPRPGRRFAASASRTTAASTPCSASSVPSSSAISTQT